MLEVNDFNAIRISLASPEQIRGWSYGEVTKPETINYRTLKPEKDGLFCERIFGPTKDWECYCGKYKRVRYKGIICDKCGVEVARAKVRRERMGHIELASPVSHIWYFKGTPSRLSLLLDISPRNLEKILYFAQFIIYEVDENERAKAMERIDQEEVEKIAELEANLVTRQAELRGEIPPSDPLSTPEGRVEDRRLRRERVEREHEEATERGIQAASDLTDLLQTLLGEVADKDYTLGEQTIVTADQTVEQAQVDEVKEALRALLQSIDERRDQELAALTAEEEQDLAAIAAAIASGNAEVEPQIAALTAETERAKEAVHADAARKREDLESIKLLDLPTESRVRELQQAFPTVFKAGMGAEALRTIIKNLSLDKLAQQQRDEIHGNHASSMRRKKATKRLRVIEAFRKNGPKPEWMILEVLPVIPPDLRPMVQLDGGRFATSDLNDLYRRVINRNNRLKRLLELNAPEIIVRNEKRMLQEACDALIDNGRRGRAVSGSGNHKLKSLSDMLKGKQGRFRQNLLGKRVDYSGRSVIVVGPELKLHQCGLPKRMALELFKPFVMRKLVERNFAHNIRSAKRLIERVHPAVWDVLEEVIQDHPVLLNRAPTLHRLGIQAFEAILVEGSAIQIHPLVCHAFNADFDGDQMAVHVPLSRAAQLEAKTLMLSSRNLLSPASGEPTVAPTKDMVLGCYYLTYHVASDQDDKHVFGDFADAVRAYDTGRIGLHTYAFVLIPSRDMARVDASDAAWVETPVGRFRPSDVVTIPNSRARGVHTTVGRIIFNEVLPASMPFRNDTLDKGKLRDVIGDVYRDLGPAKTATVADDIKRLGFTYATKSGTTMAISDVTIPDEKEQILADTQKEVDELDRQFRRGLITQQERYESRIRRWTDARDKVTKAVTEALDRNGSIYIMAMSGAAKGHFTQVSQIAGMRGLMADPSGQIIDLPIKSNFREGLTMLEYFISTHGARKGLADTALRTAESGYLTRRLIDVGQDVIIYDEDCHNGQTKDIPGILISAEEAAKAKADDFRSRIGGRWLAEPFVDTETGERIADANEEVTETLAGTIYDMLIHGRALGVRVRSVLTCMSKRGVCRLCYGWSMATRHMVMRGDAVGIIAAESIGEPGTQLTMRTFHTGGVAGEDITQGLPRVEELFEARVPKERAILSEIDGEVEVQRGDAEIHIFVTAAQRFTEPYVLPQGYVAAVESGTQVEKGAVLAEPVSESEGEKLTARKAGTVNLDGDRLLVTYEDVDRRDYPVPNTARIKVETGQNVNAGDMLTEGSKNPEDLLNVLGPQAVQKYLVDEVQRVYKSQGVSINDKHIEVIVRQMLRRVRVETPGDTELLPGELVDRFTIDEVNRSVLAQDGEPATAKTVLLGVTKASLNTDSFLAAASFQETTRVLTDAAISGKKDRLMGLKENVIIGKLIPAGSGLFARTRRPDPVAALLGGSDDTLDLEGEGDHDAIIFAEEEAGRANALLGAGDEDAVSFDLEPDGASDGEE